MDTQDAPAVGSAPLPRPVDRSQRRRLIWNGLRDRLRCREVADDGHTHYTRVLLAEAHLGQAAVDKWSREIRAGLQARIGELVELVSEPTTTPAMQHPTEVTELQSLTGLDRARWAAERRANDAARRLARQEADARTSRQRELLELREQRETADESAQAAQVLWQRDFDRRAAIYTRARTGVLGLKVLKPGEVPAFVPPLDGARLPIDHGTYKFNDQLRGVMA